MPAAIDPALDERRRRRLDSLIASAELDGARWQFWVTSGALLVVALLFIALNRWNAALAYMIGTLLFFMATTAINFLLARRGVHSFWASYLLGALNIAFLTFIIIAPNPFAPSSPPPAIGLREGGFKYLLIFVCLGALALSPRLAAWLGVTAAACWAAAVAWVLQQPQTVTMYQHDGMLGPGEHLQIQTNPNFVDVAAQATNIVVVLVVAGIVSAVVARTRQLALEYTMAERARFNLSRHFSPNVVDEIATDDEPFGPVRRQEIAVLFADIAGFTAFTEDHTPEEVFQLLREFHNRMEHVVFEAGGTVDNYIGDCIMATFGVPRPSPDDAANALACARAMHVALAGWNRERIASGLAPVDIRIGCQFGTVVIGAIGSERNLSFAVVGDTCNVASRLQSACKELKADICAGSALISRIDRQRYGRLLDGMQDVGPQRIRGRDEPVPAWILADGTAAST